MRPPQPEEGAKDLDESTDTYDTIDCFLKNVKEQQTARSASGAFFLSWLLHTAAGMIDAHPALKSR